MKRASKFIQGNGIVSTGRRVLVWAAASLLGALVTSFPLAAAAASESSADLSVAQVATNPGGDAVGSTAKLYAGQVVTYTVTVTNSGPSDAESVTLTETAPAEVDTATLESCDPQAVDCSVDANFSDYASGTALSLGTIAATTSKEMVFRGTVASGTLPGVLTNVASVSSAAADPDTTNSTDVALVTPVDTLADISVSQVANNSAGKVIGSGTKARAGQVITYVATVKNAGPSDARNVKVKNTFGSGVTNLRSCLGGSCSSYQNSSLLSLGAVGAGSTKTVSFRGTLPSTITATTDVTNVVSVKSYKAGAAGATADSDSGDATSTLTTSVYKAASTTAPATNTPSTTNNTTAATSGSTTGVYFGRIGAPTYFQPQLRTKTVVIRKVYYTSAFGRRIPAEASAPVVESATSTVVAPVANRIVRAPEEVWLLLPAGLLLIIWITYLVLEPYEDQLLASRSKNPGVSS